MNAASSTPRDEHGKDDTPVLTLIKQIRDSRLDPAQLTTEDRRRCVEVLWSEGYTVANIAQILQRGERTIYRDRSALRSEHALHVHPRLAVETAGELTRQAEGSAARLRRIAREPNASAMERCMAEHFAFKIYTEMITKLQSLGFLPRIPTGVVAQVVGASHNEVIPTYDELARNLDELSSLDQEMGSPDPKIVKHRNRLKELVERGRFSAEIVESYDRHREN